MTPAPTNAAQTPGATPPTCEVRDWTVFGPGYHKLSLYSPEMCDRVPANFERLRDQLTPLAKIGHDRQQRLAKSLGFINVGKVTRCVAVGGGNFALTITGIPTSVGAEINAGRLNSGSVELLPKIADPDDPATDIAGPILTGVAFLGEEQPAVKGFDPPRAVFTDGTPVPPARDPAPWLNAMAEVTTLSAGSEPDHAPRFRWLGREYAAQTISFSEMNMDQKAQLAAIGLTPEQVEQVLQITAEKDDPAWDAANPQLADGTPAPMNHVGMGAKGRFAARYKAYADDPKATDEKGAIGMGGGAIDAVKDAVGMGATAKFAARYKAYADDPKATDEKGAIGMGGGAIDAVKDAVGMGATAKFAARCKAYADDPKATDEQKMMAALFSELDDMKKRQGATEKMAEDMQKKDEEIKMAAFAEAVGAIFTNHRIAERYSPDHVARIVRPELKRIGAAKTYASGSDRLAAAKSYIADLAELKPIDARLAGRSAAAPTPAASNNPILAAIVRKGGVLDRLSPAITKTHRDGTAT